MTWLEPLFGVIITTLIAGLLYAMPSIVHSTVPLGVNIPQSRVGEPVVRRAVRNYRISIVGCWVVAIVCGIVFGLQPLLAITLPVLLMLVLGFVAYLVTRAMISRAKRDGNWYEGVSVRRVAEVTAPTVRRPPLGWAIASVLILLAVVVTGIILYPGMPQRIPMHWNGAGEVDRYAAKSIFSVFGPVLIGFGVVVLLYAASYLGRVSPGRPVASDTPAQAAQRAQLQHRLLTSLLGQLSLLISVVFAAVTVAGWLASGRSTVLVVLPIGMIVLMAVILIVFLVRYSRAMARSRGPRTADAGTPDSPDDDRYWKAGAIYVNHDDPAVFVPKRFGVGWTINAGSPGGIALLFVLVIVVVGGIVMGIVAPGHHG